MKNNRRWLPDSLLKSNDAYNLAAVTRSILITNDLMEIGCSSNQVERNDGKADNEQTMPFQ